MKLHIIKLILITIVMCGCSKNEEENGGTQKPTPAPLIKLSTYHVTTFSGMTSYIDVISEGEYGLLEDDPDIATGWWQNEGNTIKIITEKVGGTTIWIEDLNTKDVVGISVASVYFTGFYKDALLPSGLPRIIPCVQAQDQAVQKIIESEIVVRAQQRVVVEYGFCFEDNISTFIMRLKNSDDLITGTYEWSNDLLILKYNEITERYGFHYEHGGKVTLTQDFTNEYKALYPNAGVSIVRTNRDLSMASGPPH